MSPTNEMNHMIHTPKTNNSNNVITINDTDSEHDEDDNEPIPKRLKIKHLELENRNLRLENIEIKEKAAKTLFEYQTLVLEAEDHKNKSDKQHAALTVAEDESFALKSQNLLLTNSKNLSDNQQKKVIRQCDFKIQDIRKQKRHLKHQLFTIKKSSQKEIETIKSELLKNVNLLTGEQNKVNKLRTIKQRLESYSEQKDKEKAELQHQNQLLLAQINPNNFAENQQLKQQLEAKNRQIASLEKENGTLRQNVKVLEDENDNLAVRVNSMNSKSALLREVEQLRAELKTKKNQLDEAHDDKQLLIQDLQFANEEKKVLNDEIAALKNTCHSQESKIDELHDEILASNTEIALLSSQLKESKQQNDALKSENSQFDKQKKVDEAKIQQFNQQLDSQKSLFEEQLSNAKTVNDQWSENCKQLTDELSAKAAEWESSSNLFKETIEVLEAQISEITSVIEPLFLEEERLNIRIADLRSTLNEEQSKSKAKSKDCKKLEQEIAGIINEKKEICLLYEKAMNDLKACQGQSTRLEEKHVKLKEYVKNFEVTHKKILQYGRSVDQKLKETQTNNNELKQTIDCFNEEMARFQSQCHQQLADKDSEIRRLNHSLNNAHERINSMIPESLSN